MSRTYNNESGKKDRKIKKDSGDDWVMDSNDYKLISTKETFTTEYFMGVKIVINTSTGEIRLFRKKKLDDLGLEGLIKIWKS